MATFPSRIGKFDVVRQLGSGGMGAVYLGRDAELDRQVAIKVIREEVHDQEVLDRFFREARAAAALRHPNIITIYASGQHEHQPYMVMEFVEGESLADIIRSRRNLSLADKLSYLEQLCAGLHFAHRAGIVHRDIKPANVMVDKEGIVRILDFGIARIEGSAMTQDGALIGSLNYMSPEQMLGRPVDHRSDIFSVGSVSYELICYQQAFKGGLNDGLLNRLPHEDPPPLHTLYPGLPPGLEQVVMSALRKAPENRFQDLAEMRNALLDVQRGLTAVEEERTIVIARPGTASPSPTGVSPIAPPPATGPSVVAPSPPAPPPPSALSRSTPSVVVSMPFQSTPSDIGSAPIPPPPVSGVGITQGGGRVGEPGVGTPAPGAAQTWSLKKKTGSETIAKGTVPAGRDTAVNRETPAKPDATVTKRPPTAVSRTAQPPAPQPSSSRKWILVGGAAIVVAIGAAVTYPLMTAEPPSALERERSAIEATMERFRMAYRNRDLAAVTAVFPSLPPNLRQSMQKTFDNCIVYEVTFADMTVAMTPPDATQASVQLRSTHICNPESGARQTTSTERDVFTLRKNGDNWVISGLTVSPAG